MPRYRGSGLVDRAFLFDDLSFADADAFLSGFGDAIPGECAICDVGLLDFELFYECANRLGAGRNGKLDEK